MDGEWFAYDDQLTCFRKSRESILVQIKRSGTPSIQGPQYYEEDLVFRERVTSSTDTTSVIDTGTN